MSTDFDSHAAPNDPFQVEVPRPPSNIWGHLRPFGTSNFPLAREIQTHGVSSVLAGGEFEFSGLAC